MAFTHQLTWSLSRYVISHKLRGVRRFPLVLMLEPSFRCNLACNGCGRIREYRDILDRTLSAEECLAAVDEAGAPVVSITGGEPLLHPDIGRIVDGIIAGGRFVNLCTNGQLLERSLSKFRPGPHVNFVLHMDGLAPTHDKFAGREGVFETAIAGMRAAKQAGFSVLINTTVYKGANLKMMEQLFTLLSAIPVDGIMMAPAFSYEAVNGDYFLTRKEATSIFRSMNGMTRRYSFYNTPVYLDFLAGRRQLTCAPWSTPTRNPAGWKRPCYLITDGHCRSFSELMDETQWHKYGPGNDPRCANCMVHCGFEGSALEELGRSPSALWQTISWNFANSRKR